MILLQACLVGKVDHGLVVLLACTSSHVNHSPRRNCIMCCHCMNEMQIACKHGMEVTTYIMTRYIGEEHSID